MTTLPFEIIQIIYNFSSIDEKIKFNKLLNHESFISQKLLVSTQHLIILNQIINFKHSNYIIMQSLSKYFSFL